MPKRTPGTPLESMAQHAEWCGLKIVYLRQPNPAENEVGLIAFIPAGMSDDAVHLEQVETLRQGFAR